MFMRYLADTEAGEADHDTFDEVWAEIADSWSENDCSGDDFITVARDGMWVMMNRFTWESDRMLAQARKGAATTFCTRYGLPKIASFSYSTHTPEGASVLAVEHCRKLQYFFNIWQARGGESYLFSEAEVRNYAYTEHYRTFTAGLPLGSATKHRATALELLAPGEPRA